MRPGSCADVNDLFLQSGLVHVRRSSFVCDTTGYVCLAQGRQVMPTVVRCGMVQTGIGEVRVKPGPPDIFEEGIVQP